MTKLIPAAMLAVAAAASDARAQEATPVEKIEVLGTAERAYRMETLNSLGPLGSTKILDAPYVISVLPADILENAQVRNLRDALKYLPLVSFRETPGNQILRPQTRGMQGANFQNSRMDGMTMFITVANAIEQFQQIEVVNGVASSLYGPSNPSGMFNFVLKRPTVVPLARATLAYDTQSILTGHLDLSGKIDDAGMFLYRANLLAADGEGHVDHSTLNRKLGSFSVDIRPRTDTVLEVNYSDYRVLQKGYPGWFNYNQTLVLPDAPDPTRVGYGQEYLGLDLKTRTYSVRAKQDVNADWRWVFGVLQQDAWRDDNTPINTLLANANNYTSSMANGSRARSVTTSDMGYLNGTFNAWGVGHDLTLGTAGYKSKAYAVRFVPTPAQALLGAASIDNPQVYPFPAAGLPNTADQYVNSIIYQQGVNIGDMIRFNDAWSTYLSVSQDWIKTKNYNIRYEPLPGYKDNGASPTASLIFRPAANMSAYLTLASALQAGDLAPGTAANASSSLAPYRSEQVEVGFKMSRDKMDFAAAVFRIERPFARVDPADNVFKAAGDQVNNGVEFTVNGEIVDRLTVVGGLTWVDTKMKNTGNPATEGKMFTGWHRFRSNFLFEYRVPGIEGLVAVFDWQHLGKRPGNDSNSFFVASYDLFDVGVRYTSKLMDRRVAWRLAVNNVADKRYWSSLAPGNIVASNSGVTEAHLGAPRTVSASVSVDF